MPPYNAYSSLNLSKLSITPTSQRSHSVGDNYTSSYLYKPPSSSLTLLTKYRSPSRYSSNSLSSSSSYLRSYNNSVLKSSDQKWRSTSVDLLYRSPSSTKSYLTTPRTSSPSLSSSTENVSSYKSNTLCYEKSNDSGRVGLSNLGNTCFMNAVLQCLCHTEPLVDYFLRGSYLRDINHRSPSHGDLVKAFAEFVKKMIESKPKGPISPYQLRTEIQKFAPRFSGDNQHDAQEFLRYLLQGIHDDINRIKFKSTRRYYNECGRNATSAWNRYTDSDDSLIVDLFAGQLKSVLTCTECSNESIKYDPFWDLSLPIPQGYLNLSLRQCLSLFSSPEILDGSNKPVCEVCKKKTISSKKIEVHKFPRILVIHLKRFSVSSYGEKLKQMIDSPIILGNLSELSSFSSIGCSRVYSLYGVVDHDGSKSSGHYTAKCRNPVTKEWNEFNDSRVSKATNIVTSKSYMLFYIQE